MCGRLSLGVPPSLLRARFDASPPPGLGPRYNVAPGDDLAVLQSSGAETIDLLEWGMIPSWADDPSHGHINARAETVVDTPSFRESVRERRCLVLADGYYEWADERGRGSQPYRITRTDDEPFAMAGVWDRWAGPAGPRETVAILTTTPNEVTAPIHDRMPVVLDPADEAAWLSTTDPTGFLESVDPLGSGALEAYSVSTRVNDVGNDDPSLVDPVDPPGQRGLEEFT